MHENRTHIQDLLSPSPSGRWQRPSKPPYAGSNPARDTVAVADLVMQRSVEPPYAGSNPVGHPYRHVPAL